LRNRRIGIGRMLSRFGSLQSQGIMGWLWWVGTLFLACRQHLLPELSQTHTHIQQRDTYSKTYTCTHTTHRYTKKHTTHRETDIHTTHTYTKTHMSMCTHTHERVGVGAMAFFLLPHGRAAPGRSTGQWGISY